MRYILDIFLKFAQFLWKISKNTLKLQEIERKMLYNLK